MRWFRRKETDKPSGRTVPEQEENNQRRAAFNDVIRTVDSLLLGISSITERAAIYDFVIWTLGQQIAAHGNMLFVSGKDTPENREYDLSTLFPGINVSSEGVQEFDLAKIPTYTGPWELNRFPNAIQSIFTHGFRHEMAHNNGIFYKELNFAVMLNGRHHTSWGVFTGECVQPMEVISLEPYFPYVTTDGAYLDYTDEDGHRVRHKLIDYRLAAMYRLAQMKWEAGYPMDLSQRVRENRHTLAADARVRICSAQEKGFEVSFKDLLIDYSALSGKQYCQSKELDFWKEQAEVKDKRIKELEQLRSSK